MIKTRTSKGVEVELEGISRNSVMCVFEHDGKKVRYQGTWQTVRDQAGIYNPSVLVSANKKVMVLLMVPKEAYDQAISEYLEEKERAKMESYQNAKNNCPDGYEPCSRNWANGDLWSAEYETIDGIKVLASDQIEPVDGWYLVPVSEIQNAKERQQARQSREEDERTAFENQLKAAYEKAKETNTRVELRTWVTDECHQNLSDCSFDAATEWVYPDGSRKIEYRHCH
ncbi:MAG: hypothetical protein SVY53_12010 [Chloroflexota bacterium]|nr:hypothetical protein [Chloroflexota bacterium]